MYSFHDQHHSQVLPIICKETLEDILAHQDLGIDWLDSVDHLLEKDADGSRTAAYSGYEVDDLRRQFGVKLEFTAFLTNT